MEGNKSVKFQMRISSINVLKFSQFDLADFDTNKKNLVEYQSSFEVKVLDESEEIGIQANVKLKIIELDEYFGELKVLFKFHLTPFDVVAKKIDEVSFQIPDFLMLNFTNIVIGTLRGILFEKLKGTPLQNEIFPLIDLNEIVKQNDNS
jgi:hypothetical protein